MSNHTETFLSRARAWQMSSAAWLGVILLVGFAVRLAFIGSEGFAIDTNDFADWALALAGNHFANFYRATSFADYPPGYLYVLWGVGKFYALAAPHGNPELLRWLVKAPAILMDLCNAGILYALVRRFADERWGLIASAAYTLNPAVIFISAVWGQVDSVAVAFALVGMHMLLPSADAEEQRALKTAAAFAALSLYFDQAAGGRFGSAVHRVRVVREGRGSAARFRGSGRRRHRRRGGASDRVAVSSIVEPDAGSNVALRPV